MHKLNLTKAKLGIWALLLVAGESVFWILDGEYLQNPGIYLHESYRGLFFSSLLYAGPPVYFQAVVLFLQVGGLLLLPTLVLLHTRFKARSQNRDVSGNYVDRRAFAAALRSYDKYAKRSRWRVRLHDRNKIWCGVDLITGEDVYLEGEDIFKGIVVIGAQGTGKTSRFFKALIKQLAMDPQQRTAFCVFTLKSEDSAEFFGFLKELGQKVIHWAMCNVVDLCLSPTGGLQQETLQAYIQGAALSTGLESKDPFWLNGSIARLVGHLLEISQEGGEPTLGNAYQMFSDRVKALGAEARMEQGLLETLKPALEPMADPASRVSVLHSPNEGGGLHFGPLFAAPNRNLLRLDGEEKTPLHTCGKPVTFPEALYEVPRGGRLPFDWERLLAPTSVILPPPGKSKAELFALNFIKASLLGWISADISSANSRLLRRDPQDRLRIVLAQDEGHAFLSLDPPMGETGFSDTRALAENRQAGQVSIIATQSLSRLHKSSREKVEDFLSVNGNYFFMGVNGQEREKVLRVVGKVGVRRIDRSFGQQEEGPGQPGQLAARSPRGSMNESIREDSKSFISEELYGQFREGMAIHVSQGKPHRLVYCPFHSQLQIEVGKKSFWGALWKRN